ncbi:MAG: ZIP family metal transporter [Candidatus Aenigmarchaeota archaeon]|nr:ZIP family metal transporter [Candidatus Aenigmarchaeota archaeon]
MSVIILILASTFLVSCISLVGILTLSLREKLLDEALLILVSLSAGTMMGGAFFHLLPESVEISANINIFIYVIFGFLLFFFMEKSLFWRHCHRKECDVHTFAYMNLAGDLVHNFIDSLAIAASSISSVGLGIVTTLAISFHEVPQEIGDFGMFLFGGFKKKKALILNFLTALSAVLGGVIGYLLSMYLQRFVIFLLSLTAGGFICIASSDLIPEIRKIEPLKQSLLIILTFCIGIIIMWMLKS